MLFEATIHVIFTGIVAFLHLVGDCTNRNLSVALLGYLGKAERG